MKFKYLILYLLIGCVPHVFGQNITLLGSDICSDGSTSTSISISDSELDLYYVLFKDGKKISLRQYDSGFEINPIDFGEFSDPGIYEVFEFKNFEDTNTPGKGKKIGDKIQINPIPMLLIKDEPIQIKSGETFKYQPRADVKDTEFTWTTAINSGKLKKHESNGSGNIAIKLELSDNKPAELACSITPIGPSYKGGCMGETKEIIIQIVP